MGPGRRRRAGRAALGAQGAGYEGGAGSRDNFLRLILPDTGTGYAGSPLTRLYPPRGWVGPLSGRPTSARAGAAPPTALTARRAVAAGGGGLLAPRRPARTRGPPAPAARPPDGPSPFRNRNEEDSESEDEDKAYQESLPTWRNRFWTSCVYFIPYVDSLMLGRCFYSLWRNNLQFYVTVGILPRVYYCHQFAPLIVFFALFLLVVRNRRCHHFTRFHVIQAIVIDVGCMLATMLYGQTPKALRVHPIQDYIMNTIYITVLVTILYSWIGCLLGIYPEIPLISSSSFYQLSFVDQAMTEEGDKGT